MTSETLSLNANAQGEFDRNWPLLPFEVRTTLKHQVAPLTDRLTANQNAAYLIGYVAAAYKYGHMRVDVYTWAVTFIYRMLDRQALQEMVRKA